MTGCATRPEPPKIEVEDRPAYPSFLTTPDPEPAVPETGNNVSAARYATDLREWGRGNAARLEVIACVEAGQSMDDCGANSLKN